MAKEWSEKGIESLVQLSSFINSSLDIIEVLDNSLRVVEDLMDTEASSIFEVDPEKNELFFRMARGETGGKTKEIRMKMGEGIVGWVASSGEPLLVPDTEKDKRFSKKVDYLTGFKTKSIIALPIRNKGRIIGVLEVLNKRGPYSFDNKDLKMLKIVANQMGIAIENARLYARLKEKFALKETELKQIQEKLIQSERLAALGELSKGVAHAVRNPVMSIGGFTRRIKKKIPSDNSAAGYIDLILEETARLEKIVKNVVEYTSISEPELKQVRISELLQSVFKDWEKKYSSENIKIEVKLLPEDPIVFVDIKLMANALIHLLQNAKDAMSKGGVITISTWWENKWMVISVRDNGRGIFSQHLPIIFDPLFTTKTYGSGLGLTIVNRIMSGHGGEVKISSTPGAGTEVRICFSPFSGSENPI